MAKYIGYVEITTDLNRNTHFNFRPLAEVVGQKINTLFDKDLSKILSCSL